MRRTVISALTTLAFLVSVVALAQSSGGEFEIVKNTIDGGGGMSQGGDFSLTGTIGQPDAGNKVLTGGKFSLSGGFWANATIVDALFKDSFESN